MERNPIISGLASTVICGKDNGSSCAIFVLLPTFSVLRRKNDRVLRMYKRWCTHCIGLTTEVDSVVRGGRD